MGFKDILVHVDNYENSPARLRAAIKMAQDFDARLTGLYVIYKAKFPAYAEAGVSAETLENEAKLAEQQVNEAEKGFLEASGKSGLQSEWRVEEGITAEIFPGRPAIMTWPWSGRVIPTVMSSPAIARCPTT